MILAYLFCLVSGGILITLSLTSDSGFDNDGTGGQLTLLFSTPFWSFSLCSFGLFGLLATLLAPSQPHLVVVAGLAGLSMGGGAPAVCGPRRYAVSPSTRRASTASHARTPWVSAQCAV